MKICQHPKDNHSKDIIKVWHGSPNPLYLCGYHTQHNLNQVLELIKETKKENITK